MIESTNSWAWSMTLQEAHVGELAVSLVSANDSRWSETLERCRYDVYHQPAWSLGHETLEHGTACAAVASFGNDVAVVPLIRRDLADRWDATSPYGYSGYASSTKSASTVSRMISGVTDHLAERGCVSLFLRLHPLLNLEEIAPGTTVEHGPTVVVDLREDEASWWQGLRKGHRSDINRARKLGVVTSRENPECALGFFSEMYSETMRRVEATDQYPTDRSYFQTLFDGLGASLELWVARLEGAPIGASMFSRSATSRIAQYLFSATEPKRLGLQPSKLLLADYISDSRRTALDQLHLGGGLGAARDSLFDFKAGFSKREATFRTARFVLDPAAYERECGDAETASELDGYFPRYRRPTAKR